ncbi:RNA polymerase sigma factor [Bacteroides sp.]|uniref:RNA polymerase sigma factor n=1 Tax=Bacteroides sp. TaxID=29523 RepID=UPI002632FE33|nr:RNA polymerase sigma factor [Bacteroides sp.]
MDFEKELSSIYPWILGIARKYCCSIQEAEDLAGDTIYKVLSNKTRFEHGRPLKPWCEVILINTFITNYNRKTFIRYVDFEKAFELSSYTSIPDILSFKEIVAIIRRCAAKSCSIECVIYYAKGYSYDEISEILHIPVGTVRSRIFLGRKMLSRELDL